jgi:hypothetical protein
MSATTPENRLAQSSYPPRAARLPRVDRPGLLAVLVAAAGLLGTVLLFGLQRAAPAAVPGPAVIVSATVATPLPLRPGAADLCDSVGNCWVP